MKKIIFQIKQLWGGLTLKNKLLVSMISVTISCVLIVCIYFYIVSTDLVVKYSNNSISNTLSQVKDILEQRVIHINDNIYDICLSDKIQTGFEDMKYNNLEEYEKTKLLDDIRRTLMLKMNKTPEILGIYMYTSDDSVVYVNQRQYNIPDIDNDKFGNGEIIWLSPNESSEYIYIVKTIYSLKDIKEIGKIVLQLDLDYLTKPFNNIIFNEDDTFIICDDINNIIYSSKYTSTETIKELSKQELGKTFNIEVEGIEKQACMFELEIVPWKVISITQDLKRVETLQRLFTISIIVLFVLFILIIVVVLLISKGITKPITELCISMKEFSKGNTISKKHKIYNDEIGVLTDTFYQMINEINILMENYKTEQMLKQQAKIHALQMQMNPHFLYNTLDTINWLSIDGKYEKIGIVARSLGSLFRFSLGKEMWISLEEELDAVEQYIKIQKCRYSDRLNFKVSVSEEVLYEQIPRHTILPLIENCIEHGMTKERDSITIDVDIQMITSDLIVIVSDNGIGLTDKQIYELNEWLNSTSDINPKNKKGHMTIGLKNIHRRLKFYYGENCGVTINSKLNEGTTIKLKLKQKD